MYTKTENDGHVIRTLRLSLLKLTLEVNFITLPNPVPPQFYIGWVLLTLGLSKWKLMVSLYKRP